MIKIPIVENDSKKLRPAVTAKYINLEEIVINDNEFIPLRLGGIASGVPVNELGKQLLKAAGDGDVKEIKVLLTKGAPFTADWLGTSPLHVAAQNNNLEVCKMLLRAGISRDARTKVDRTPLHMAAYEGHLEIVDTLLKHGADAECKDLLGMTPLHWAVQNAHVDIVKLLVAKGCQTNLPNKFDLTPIEIANQLNRNDLIEILSSDPTIAAQNLVIQLAPENVENTTEYPTEVIESIDAVPVETVMIEDDMELEATEDVQPEVELPDNTSSQDNSFSDSIKLLQEHGITMLPNEENNILSTVMESGHSVVLTEVGKEVLDSVKQSEEALSSQNKKVYTVSADEFLAMTNEALQKNVLRPVKVISCKNTGKRIMMRKNRIIPISTITQLPKLDKEEKKPSLTDMELVMSQLIEARKTIEEYKTKLSKKEKEAERYKQQLQLLMNAS